MLKYILKRIIYLIPTIGMVAVMVFLLIHMIPGDPALVMLGNDATPQDVEALRDALGLNQPLYQQFFLWVGRVLTGDFGVSIHSKVPVLTSIADRFPVTLSLTTLALVFSLIVSIPSGVLAAVKHNTKSDYMFMLGTILGVSVPGFWLGLLCLLVFSVQLGWFPSTGFVAIWENFWEGLRYLLLPAVTLGLFMAAVVARMVRSSMLEVLRLEYVTHARAKGLSEWKVINKHALKNAFAPALTTIGIQYGMLLGGAVITETVFSLPGLGKYLVVAINMRDYPVVQGCILFIALVYVLINLVVDLLYGFFDPRIEYK
ncbi:MAG: ABC transporter permease [Desulfarculaceae bacterium]|nr:ABC transporter permease [Desulfarculaceae bacterium]MCF8074499.1 ABC transporter permease [Desulfarculaceae bacterium]MCF8103598.1 ABC transporter permease [Desulfarculaceae bacterium]MCF8118388.1 ABC transporter permease [Desulfarculaceae bacterium]